MEGIIAVAIVLALLNIGFAFLRSQWKTSGDAAVRARPQTASQRPGDAKPGAKPGPKPFVVKPNVGKPLTIKPQPAPPTAAKADAAKKPPAAAKPAAKPAKQVPPAKPSGGKGAPGRQHSAQLSKRKPR